MSIHAIQYTDRCKRIVGIMKIGNRNINEEQVFGGGYSAVFYDRSSVRKQGGGGAVPPGAWNPAIIRER
jgi:hypothetical protein